MIAPNRLLLTAYIFCAFLFSACEEDGYENCDVQYPIPEVFDSPIDGPESVDEINIHKEMKKFAEKLIEENKVHGLVIGVTSPRGDYVQGFGRKNPGLPIAPDGNTFYEIASNTKTFTGLLWALEVVNKKASLNDKAQDFLPAGVHMPRHKYGREITIHDLLTHSSGLPLFPTERGEELRNVPFCPEDLEDFLNSHKVIRPTGIKYEYSNFGFAVLGNLLERKYNRTFEELVALKISEPLGLTNTKIRLSEKDEARLASGTVRDGKHGAARKYTVMNSAGSLRSTANDMLRYLKVLAGAHTSPEMRAAMDIVTIQNRIGKRLTGLDWFTTFDEEGHQMYWHLGQTLGYMSISMFIKDTNVGAVVLAAVKNDTVISKELLDIANRGVRTWKVVEAQIE